MSIEPRDEDLARLSAASQSDPFLRALAGGATVGGSYTLGLLVNGMTVYGQTAQPEQVAAALDAANERLIALGEAASGDSEPWAEARATLDGLYARELEKKNAESEEVRLRYTDTSREEIPEEGMRVAIRDTPVALTLADATVFPASGPHFKIPLLRVALAQVAGWWLVPTDENGRATIAHPSAG